jgi:hypothetical protein
VEIRPDASSSADQLAEALARHRAQLASVPDEEERAQRADAIDRFAQYAVLLREATAAALARYSFKLVFADGRWDVAEKDLPAPPHIGELVDLADGERWRIRGSQLVRPRPPGKPPHEYFVCTPAG